MSEDAIIATGVTKCRKVWHLPDPDAPDEPLCGFELNSGEWRVGPRESHRRNKDLCTLCRRVRDGEPKRQDRGKYDTSYQQALKQAAADNRALTPLGVTGLVLAVALLLTVGLALVVVL